MVTENIMRPGQKHHAKPVMQETLAFVSLAPGATAADLEAAGMKVENICGGIAIVRLPVSEDTRYGFCHPYPKN